MRRVPPVQHQRVPVRIAEEGHVADAGVEGLAVELDARALELGARRRHVRHPQRDVRGVRRRERLADVRRVDQVEADVLAELVLGPGVVAADERQAERLAVEALRALHVRHRHGDEVRALDRDHESLPSRGA